MILEENKLEPNFPPYTKIKYTSIKDLNVKENSPKNIWENIYLGLGSQK